MTLVTGVIPRVACHVVKSKQNPFDLGHSGSGHKKDPLNTAQGIGCSARVTHTTSMPEDVLGDSMGKAETAN